MKLKLDENLGTRGAELLRQAGHNVATVYDEGMCSTGDRVLIAACVKESRCLVSLDLDFSNTLIFKPSEYPGIAVLRLPPRATPEHLLAEIRTLVQGLSRTDITGKLWVIERGRIRVHQEDDKE